MTTTPKPMNREEFLAHLDSEKTFFEAMQKQEREMKSEREDKSHV